MWPKKLSLGRFQVSCVTWIAVFVIQDIDKFVACIKTLIRMEMSLQGKLKFVYGFSIPVKAHRTVSLVKASRT